MTLADAIEQQTAANEERLSAGIRVSMQLDADAALRLDSFNRFCTQHGVRNCPSRPSTVAAFVRSEKSLGTEPHKIALALSAIELLHDRHSCANPVATAVVRKELERILQIEAPRSWSKAEQLMFASLPGEIRAVISRREQQRETALRRAQNKAAEAKRQSGGADKPATDKEEIENVDQKTQ
jgi:hypothetical protein